MRERKPIIGYEGYEVDRDGNVYSHKRKAERVLRPRPDNKGYLHVNLCKNGTLYTHSVHRLVAQAFIPNPLNLPQVNHKDEDKTNNHADNLEWCSNYYNATYGTNIARTTQKIRDTIVAINLTTGEETIYHGVRTAGKMLGIKNQLVSAVLRGKQKQTHGYVFKYIEKGANRWKE